jgi:hypothetical protein
MADQVQVFISSTSDLREERLAIADKLPKGIKPYLYEKDRPRRASPEEWCRKQINESKVFVGILGASWGTPYPPPRNEGSIVKWEFTTARSLPDLEIMAFIKKPEPSPIDPEQQQFIKEIEHFESGVWRDTFDTTDRLVIEVLNSVFNWYIEYRDEEEKKQAEVPPQLHKYLAPISIAAIGLIILTALFARFFHYSPVFIYVATGLGILVLAGCFLLIRSQMGGKDGRDS